ncbi:hypothetical protein BC936DRAFT_140120 [Jimgerdemannia flammicorona]|uniref:MYND-type domain-containing protein n=1 Tax=Jimgerdemannia flammicorona TaxID=994334 RepID=A0A433B110_9FUNG|nr:hypothetical protein BC936DRAFT_140120 [Jimgerdemannia flammicorona]
MPKKNKNKQHHQHHNHPHHYHDHEHAIMPVDAAAAPIAIEPFLGLTLPQCELLLALYNELNPNFASAVPTVFPMAAAQMAEASEKRNTIGKKLERAPAVYLREYEMLVAVQSEAISRLRACDMDVELVVAELTLDENATTKDLLKASLLYGRVRDSQAREGANLSPLASPNFENAKKFYERALNEHGFSMAAAQLGSFYVQEDKHAAGANCPGLDPKKVAFDWYKVAAEMGNPMAQHKVAYFLDTGYGYDKNIPEAVVWYEKAYDQGFPDSAHNLAILYQEGSPDLPTDIKRALSYFRQAVAWDYAASANSLGRYHLLVNSQPDLAEPAGLDVDQCRETGLGYLGTAGTLGDADALCLLGIVYASRDYDVYDLDKSQSYLELALIHGDQQAYTYLVRVLRGKLEMRTTEIVSKMEQLDVKGGSELSDALVAGPGGLRAAALGLASCDNGCGRVEKVKGQFKKCANCKLRIYCSRECQKADWKGRHKAECANIWGLEPT